MTRIAITGAAGRMGRTLVQALEESQDGDPRVRRYLALALGRLDPTLPATAVAALTKALDDPDSEARISAIWAPAARSAPCCANGPCLARMSPSLTGSSAAALLMNGEANEVAAPPTTAANAHRSRPAR